MHTTCVRYRGTYIDKGDRFVTFSFVNIVKKAFLVDFKVKNNGILYHTDKSMKHLHRYD